MRVLFTTTLLHTPEGVGGSQTSTNELAAALAARGHEVAIAAGRPRTTPKIVGRLRDRIQPIAQDSVRGVPVFRLASVGRLLPAVLETWRPDVAIVQAGKVPEMARPLAAAGIPMLVYLRDTNFQFDPATVAWPRTRVVTASDFVGRVHRARGGTVDAVIPPLVDPEPYRTDGRGDRITVINLDPIKGGWLALALASRRPDWPFLFQSAWAEPRKIKDHALTLPNVIWSPATPDMRSVYARTRLLLAPTGAQYGTCEECWGRVATEAQVSGIPVVATEQGGWPESVGEGGVLVSRTEGIDAWERAIEGIWSDPARHAALAAHARAHASRESIRPDVLVGRVEAVLRDLTG